MNWVSIVRSSGLPVSASEITTFEQALGFTLPDQYRKFLLEINGGKVICENEFSIPVLGQIGVVAFYPFSWKQPFLGVKEGRELQEGFRQGLRQGIMIAHDGGTGFFFLILNGSDRGSIYFSFKDDLPMLTLEEWKTNEIVIPDCMGKVCSSFDAFGKLICSFNK